MKLNKRDKVAGQIGKAFGDLIEEKIKMSPMIQRLNNRLYELEDIVAAKLRRAKGRNSKGG